MSAAEFDVHQPVLSLFAEGIAGRCFHLRSQPLDSHHGQAPVSDGNVIYLPERVARYSSERHNLGFYRLAILHQIGFFEFGTFNLRYATALEQIPELAQREAAPTLQTATHFERLFAHFSEPDLFRQLFVLAEDLRIDCAIARRYPGIVADLERAREAQRAALFGRDGYLCALRLLALGTPGVVLGLPEAVSDAFERLAVPGASVYDSVRAALAAWPARGRVVEVDLAGSGELNEDAGHQGALRPDLVQRRLRHDATLELMETDTVTFEDSERESGGAVPPPNLDGANLSPGDVDGGVRATLEAARDDALAMLEMQELDGGETSRRLESDRSALRVGFGEVSRPGRSYFYDEWDHLRGAYRRRWCRLFEERVSGDAGPFLADVLGRHHDQIRAIRKHFEQLRAMAMLRIPGLTDGEDIDIDAAIARHADLAAGHAPDERVYVQRQPRRRDVAAAFLLDVSASTDTPIPDPDAPEPDWAGYDDDDFLHDVGSAQELDAAEPPRTVLDVQKEALTVIAMALEALGDSFAVYGFSGYGREEVEFFVAKQFEETPGPRTWRGIAGMKPRRSTRMGPAIRHAVAKLNDQDSALRILIILSDGFPQDHDYGDDRTDHTYGIRDTAKALEEARLSGVETFCITVDRAGHDYLRQMCSEDRYLVIDEIESLADVLPKVYAALAA